MVIIAMRSRITHGDLGVPIPNIANGHETCVILITPGIILEGAEIEFVELLRTLRPKDREIERAQSIFLSEEKAKGVFGIVSITAESTPQTHPTICLKAAALVWVQQFQRARAFPHYGVTSRIGVDASRR